MNYEKKYNEALALARCYYSEDANAFLIDLFPELRESEDERIRKELIDFVNHYRHNTDLTAEQAEWCKKAIAHLEKQKEKSEIPVNASACSKKPNDRSELNDFEIRLMDCMLSAQQYRQGSIDWDIVKSWAEELSGDLEEEIKKFIEEYGYERGGDKLLIAIVARHFAEWGKNNLK